MKKNSTIEDWDSSERNLSIEIAIDRAFEDSNEFYGDITSFFAKNSLNEIWKWDNTQDQQILVDFIPTHFFNDYTHKPDKNRIKHLIFFTSKYVYVATCYDGYYAIVHYPISAEYMEEYENGDF